MMVTEHTLRDGQTRKKLNQTTETTSHLLLLAKPPDKDLNLPMVKLQPIPDREATLALLTMYLELKSKFLKPSLLYL